jgi:hypothetical protein
MCIRIDEESEKKELQCRCGVEGCFQSSGGRKDLSRHMPKHGIISSDKPRLSCPEEHCPKNFGSMHDLRRHQASKHDKVEKEYWCGYPGCQSKHKMWKRRDNLRYHVEMQHGGADADRFIKIVKNS